MNIEELAQALMAIKEEFAKIGVAVDDERLCVDAIRVVKAPFWR
jgi:hypothetical protein